jgi:hypothetical protein
MPMTRHNAVYNSPVPTMFISFSRFHRDSCLVLAILLFLCCASPTTAASDWSSLEQQLAQKVGSATGPGAVALDIVNRSSLSKKDADEIIRGLRSQLNSLGLQFVSPDQAAATVKIWLSENIRNYVWVAEIHQGSTQSSVALVSMPRSDKAIYVHEGAPLTVRRIPLWSQEERILDVVSLDVNGNPLHLVVLTPDQLEIYRFQDGRYQQNQNLPIAHSRPWPRDLRGRLVLSKDHLFDIYLPGVFCQTTSAVPLSLTCHDSDDPWLLGTGDLTQSAFFSPTRNFFTGVLNPGIGKQKTATRFYSAVSVPREKYTLWLFTGVDGLLHLLDGMTEQTARLGWGSEIAGVKTACGAGWQVLATRSARDGPDSVRAFEFPDRDPLPVSQSVEFSGAVTALWTEPSGNSAIAVSRDSETGKYEAFRLAISCGQ